MGDGVYSVGEIVGAPGLDLQGTQVLGSSGPNFGSFTLLRREECYWRVRDFLFPQILFLFTLSKKIWRRISNRTSAVFLRCQMRRIGRIRAAGSDRQGSFLENAVCPPGYEG